MMDQMHNQEKTRLTQAERTEISDNRMLIATVRLIVDRGPAATSLKEVGLLAGYSRGLAGQRFGSKDKLFAFVLRQVGEAWLAQLKQATRNQTGLTAIHHALDEHFRFCVDDPEQVRAFYTLWFESVNAGSELKAIIRNIHNRRHQDMVDWILADACFTEQKATEQNITEQSIIRQKITNQNVTRQITDEANAIAAQFCASVIGIVYYWLANPTAITETKSLHENLKQSMSLYLS